MATKHIRIDPDEAAEPTRDRATTHGPQPGSLPNAKVSAIHPTKAAGDENASLYFVGTATTIL